MTGHARAEALTLDGDPLPALWASGRCPRGHDITDPANRRRSGRRRQWLCVPCSRYRSACVYRGQRVKPSVVFPDRVCEQCGRLYSRAEVRSTQGQAEWMRRRSCSEMCRLAAMPLVVTPAGREAAREAALARRNGPMDAATLARLRASVGFREGRR